MHQYFFPDISTFFKTWPNYNPQKWPNLDTILSKNHVKNHFLLVFRYPTGTKTLFVRWFPRKKAWKRTFQLSQMNAFRQVFGEGEIGFIKWNLPTTAWISGTSSLDVSHPSIHTHWEGRCHSAAGPARFAGMFFDSVVRCCATRLILYTSIRLSSARVTPVSPQM